MENQGTSWELIAVVRVRGDMRGHGMGEPLRLADELVRAMGENVEDSALVLAQGSRRVLPPLSEIENTWGLDGETSMFIFACVVSL